MIFRLLAKTLYLVIVVVEIILALRFVFVLINASRANAFVRWIQETSRVLVSPFRGIIADRITLFGLNIDLITLVTLLILLLVAYGLLEIMHTFEEPNL